MRDANSWGAPGGPVSPLSISSCSLPSLPASPRGDLTPIAAQEAPDSLCCVCLEALRPPGGGANAATPFPTCARHHMHVSCLAQFRVQATGPSELLCPLCRHSRCWKGRGSRSLARQSVLRVGSCRSSGCRAPQRRTSGPTTVAASTSLCTGQRPMARPCAATPRSSPLSLGLVGPSPGPTLGRGSRLLLRHAGARSHGTRS